MKDRAGLGAYHSLDSLYMSIFHAAFLKNKTDAEDEAMIRSVLSAVVLAVNPLSPSTITTLMGFECDEVVALLESIQSLLALVMILITPFNHFTSPSLTSSQTQPLCQHTVLHLP
jgi:hypothetical protein